MKIVVDENVLFAREYFGQLGELVLLPGRDIQAADVVDADVLIVRSVTRVDAALLSQSRVTFVGSCTIGTDHLDTDWLTAQGIAWACAPGCNATAVVEYVLAALAVLQVPLDGSARIGVVGCGNVGGRLLRCLQAHGATTACAYDPFRHDAGVPWVGFDEILRCDVLCLHTPLTRDGLFPTWHLFNEQVINGLRSGTVLLNAGRGAVVDNRALLTRLQQRGDLHVVLDVWENEPAIDAALLAAVRIGTPHIAGYSVEGKWRGTTQVFASLCAARGIAMPAIDVVLPGEPAPYPILQDDSDLRSRYALDGAQGFDALRKQYAHRREQGVASLP